MPYHKRGKLVNGYNARKHPLYNVWAGMRDRCRNPNAKQYADYGGRGITVCERWEQFENFANDMYPKPTPKHTLDRVDNDKGYSPENCRWATRQEQNKNKRVYKTNSTGYGGVRQLGNGTFVAHVSFEGKKYKLANSFDTAEQAHEARISALDALENMGLKGLEPFLKRRARRDSQTGVKGISLRKDGAYVVRVTLPTGRKYLGYYQDFEEAKKVLEDAKRKYNL